MRSKKKNEKALKRARKRLIQFRALTAVHLLADRSCDICKFNSKNEVHDSLQNKLYWSTWSRNKGFQWWSSSYPEPKESCKKFMNNQKFKFYKICHLFEEREIYEN